ncbi:MAG: hypothetical protein WD069_02065 [Planctomycetales bacterium]
MNLRVLVRGPVATLFGCGLVCTSLTGCLLQGTVGGQTLPSAYYLEDDVQYFPAGPEFKLTNQVQALEEYRAEQAVIRAGLLP